MTYVQCVSLSRGNTARVFCYFRRRILKFLNRILQDWINYLSSKLRCSKSICITLFYIFDCENGLLISETILTSVKVCKLGYVFLLLELRPKVNFHVIWCGKKLNKWTLYLARSYIPSVRSLTKFLTKANFGSFSGSGESLPLSPSIESLESTKSCS